MHRNRAYLADEAVNLLLTARGIRAAAQRIAVHPLHVTHLSTTDGAGARGRSPVEFAGGAEEKIGVADVAKHEVPRAEISQGLAAGPLVGNLVPIRKHSV